MDNRPRYLDWNATTPINQEVLEIMNYYFKVEFGNAGSRTHIYGVEAKKAVNKTRSIIANIVNADETEIIFTSGATESNNIAILGLQEFAESKKLFHIISTSIEHKAVLGPLDALKHKGFIIDLLPVGPSGRIDPNDLAKLIRKDTLLVSIMQVNNETGIIQPINECAEILQNSTAYFHVDAAQGFAKEKTTLTNKRIDFISISGHKIQGPKGIGALVTRKRDFIRPPLQPLMYGGGQEMGLRPGTLAVPLIVGMGKAAEIISNKGIEWWNEKLQTKQELLDTINEKYIIVGDQQYAMPNSVYLMFEEWDSEAFIFSKKQSWAIANGSACTSDKVTPSYVLEAMGLNSVHGAVRISW